MNRVLIQWTETAKAGLARLPHKVRRGLLDKADELRKTDDPENAQKPLTGPLQGYYRICYSRFRAIYRVDREQTPRGDVVQRIIVLFVAAGIRKEGDKNDIYRFALKLLNLGVIETRAKGSKDPRRKRKT
jgi:mRNA interferase RelE/StbE